LPFEQVYLPLANLLRENIRISLSNVEVILILISSFSPLCSGNYSLPEGFCFRSSQVVAQTPKTWDGSSGPSADSPSPFPTVSIRAAMLLSILQCCCIPDAECVVIVSRQCFLFFLFIDHLPFLLFSLTRTQLRCFFCRMAFMTTPFSGRFRPPRRRRRRRQPGR
jgi:hypothetical protein